MRGFLTYAKVVLVGFCSIALSTTLVPIASAKAIDILTSDYHIWGDIRGDIGPKTGPTTPPTIFYQTYDETSSIPISKTISYAPFNETLPFLSASSTTDIMSVSSSSSSYGIGENRANAFAEATWTFKPLYGNLNLVINGDISVRFFRGGVISVMDLTTNSSLYDLVIHGWGPWFSGPGSTFFEPFVIDPDIVFDPNHVYSLSMSTGANSVDDSNWIALNANFNAVPEPSTMLLLGSGLIGLAGLRRKFRK